MSDVISFVACPPNKARDKITKLGLFAKGVELMARKSPLENKIPKDITVGDLVAYAESIGCLVEFELKPRSAQLRNEADGTVGESLPSNIKFPDESAVAWFCECEYENMHFWALEQCPNCKKQRPKYTVIGSGS